MFFRHSLNIRPWTRPLYLTASVILGLLLSVLAHVLLETWWLSYAHTHNINIYWTNILGTCSLPLWLQIVLPIIGMIGGFMVGQIWWRLVYIERRWEKKD